ncbi:probable 6-phosphogluconolactonase 4, chloroplastic, partial [Tanacetum coccineum]
QGKSCFFVSYVEHVMATWQVPIPKSNMHAINDKLSPEDATDDYEGRLKQLVYESKLKKSGSSEFANYNLMLLGMGPDRHVAFYFALIDSLDPRG